jgi:eukaryotic-like serine/threonine-protein kinase
MDWLQGEKIDNGKYQIDKVLARGGFGIIYKATHTGLNNSVAIKFPVEKYKEYL